MTFLSNRNDKPQVKCVGCMKKEREKKQSWLDVHVGDTGWGLLQIYSEPEIQMMTDVVTKNLLRDWEEHSG